MQDRPDRDTVLCRCGGQDASIGGVAAAVSRAATAEVWPDGPHRTTLSPRPVFVVCGIRQAGAERDRTKQRRSRAFSTRQQCCRVWWSRWAPGSARSAPSLVSLAVRRGPPGRFSWPHYGGRGRPGSQRRTRCSSAVNAASRRCAHVAELSVLAVIASGSDLLSRRVGRRSASCQQRSSTAWSDAGDPRRWRSRRSRVLPRGRCRAATQSRTAMRLRSPAVRRRQGPDRGGPAHAPIRWRRCGPVRRGAARIARAACSGRRRGRCRARGRPTRWRRW